MSPLGQGWDILTSALDGAPFCALVLARTCSSNARGKLLFFASSLPSAAVCCSPAFGIFGTNLAGTGQYLAGMGATSQRPSLGTLTAHQALPNFPMADPCPS